VPISKTAASVIVVPITEALLLAGVPITGF